MAFSGEQDDDDEVMSEINMTPLVDVMLVLLIIFMLTVPILTQSIDLKLPETGEISAEEPLKAITVSVDSEGHIFWGEEKIVPQLLKTRFAKLAAETPQPPVHIRGDKTANYGYVIQVMASAQQAGLTQLGFITEINQD